MLAAESICRPSIFNGNLTSIIAPTTRAGFNVVVRTFSDPVCSVETSERFISYSQCLYNGGQDGTTGRSFRINLVASGSALAASLALLLLALFA